MDRNLKIGVVGLGLIGGSIFKALCALKCDVYAASLSNQTIQKAKKYSHNVSKSLQSLNKCDLVFVCTPMHETLQILDKLDEILSNKTVVSDVSSLKSFVSNKKRNYKFIPSHPMAGTELSGFDNSFESLFLDAKWVITSDNDTDKKDLKILTDIIEALGAKTIFTTPEEHDEAVALISHMPMLVAQAIFKTAKKNELALKLASNGFRDMTRLAMSNEEMANDMITMNSNNIQKALLELYASIGELTNKDYPTQIRNIKKERQIMYSNGKNML